MVPQEKINRACKDIEAEMEERVRFFKSEDKLLEAQRISERTNFDIEMLRETGFCSGIENYSRHLSGISLRISEIRSSICPSTGRTNTSGSSKPVGRMICSVRSIS